MVHDPRSPCEGSRGAVHLVVLVEVLQETLVDGVQVDEEEVVRWSILAGHCGRRGDPSRSALCTA
jgi:hypothetical protein